MGGKWKWIGTCSCRGQDKDCADDDTKWVWVPDAPKPANPERVNNGCMIYRGPASHGS